MPLSTLQTISFMPEIYSKILQGKKGRPVSVEAIDQELRGLIDEEDIALSLALAPERCVFSLCRRVLWKNKMNGQEN